MVQLVPVVLSLGSTVDLHKKLPPPEINLRLCLSPMLRRILMDSLRTIAHLEQKGNYGHTGRLYDYMIVFDGPTCLSAIIGLIDNSRLDTIQSSTNVVSVMFISDDSLEGQGAQVSFTSGKVSPLRSVDWYRVLEGEDCHGKTVLFAKGPSTETETWVKSFQRTVFIIINGAQLNMTYSTLLLRGSSNCKYRPFLCESLNIIVTSASLEIGPQLQSYPAYSFCNWRMDVNPEYRIKLDFTAVSIEPSLTLSTPHDKLIIFDGPSCASSVIAVVSGFSARSVMSSTNQMAAMFISDNSVEMSGFVTQFTADCNRELVGEFGEEFGNSWYTETYPAFSFCNWQITVAPGERIFLEFPSVSIENTQLSDRPYDMVLVFDGPTCASNVIGMLSGTTQVNYTSTDHQLAVMFLTDDSLQDMGFVATYTPVNCGEDLLAENGSFSTMNITRLEVCIWRLTAPADTHISVNIEYAQLRTIYDWYRVLDGNGCLAKTILYERGASARIPGYLKSSGNQITIIVVGGYLNVSFTAASCGGQLSSMTGTFNSENIAPLETCVWIITSTPNARVHLQLDLVNMTSNLDWLRVLDGDSCFAETVLYKRGPFLEPLPSIKSTGNQLTIVTVGGGLTGQYSWDCNREFVGEFTEEFGNSWGSETYPAFAFCNWQISVNPGQRIHLDFPTVNVESTQLFGRFYDTVVVFDGPTCTSNIIGMFSGTTPINFTSSVNQIAVMFFTDDSLQDFGFVASYNTMTCGGQIIAESGNLSTMNITRLELCIWHITVPEDALVTLYINHVHLHSSADWFRVFDGPSCANTPVLMEGGPSNATPIALKSMTNEMVVVTVGGNLNMSYKSGEFSVFQYIQTQHIFSFAQPILECSEHIKFEGKNCFMSPNFPLEYPPYTFCNWRLTGPTGQKILFQLYPFDVELASQKGRFYDSLILFDGPSCASPIVQKFAGSGFMEFVSASNELTAMFITDNSLSYTGFHAQFEGTLTQCGGEMTSNSGMVTTAGIEPYQLCVWRVRVENDKRIILVFESVDVHSPASTRIESRSKYRLKIRVFLCNCYLVQIVDIADSAQQTVTNCSQIFMRQRNGIISSPNYPGGYPAFAFCNWKITVAHDDRILLSLDSVQVS
ncbi:hypothetical protein PHET_00625 [Paragonimus heterotremus]|uniref:CUB domain-containing protein n=1 Tax=Paragonimus heterotremus TaxID=100268 RepID=A0A8J4TPJ7_9TREM|nr:hypothetical protein PHET_00625 [Paragonimus heterotremus]